MTNDIHAILSGVRVPEVPWVATLLVHQASARARIATAREVVKVAVRMNPAATIAIVGAIARAEPATSAAVAETAACEQPTLAADITRAAAGVAPGYAGEIVMAVCEVSPGEYRSVALAAARGSPGAGIEILRAVGEAKPQLKPYIEIELAKHPRAVPSVDRCLNNAERAHGRAAADPESARSRQSKGDKPPRGNGNPPGGRNYARP